MMAIMITAERKAKLKWNCRRGMLELDLIFERLIKERLDNMTDEQLLAFERLLEEPDPDLHVWLMGYETPDNKELVDIVAFIRCNDSP